MARSSSSSSPASVNRKSDGRTTVTGLTVILLDGKFQQSVKYPIKGTSAGELYGELRKKLQSDGKSIPNELPSDISQGFEESAGAIKFRHVLLINWRQCPNCGASADSPTPECPDCELSLNFNDQDAKDFKEKSKK